MRITEHTEGHYETQNVELGRVYRRCKESVMFECKCCGKRSTHIRSALIGSLITCECGKDHTARIREELVFQCWTKMRTSTPGDTCTPPKA